MHKCKLGSDMNKKPLCENKLYICFHVYVHSQWKVFMSFVLLGLGIVGLWLVVPYNLSCMAHTPPVFNCKCVTVYMLRELKCDTWAGQYKHRHAHLQFYFTDSRGFSHWKHQICKATFNTFYFCYKLLKTALQTSVRPHKEQVPFLLSVSGCVISVVQSIVPWPLVRNHCWFNDRRLAGVSYVPPHSHCLGHLLPCQLYCPLSPAHPV